MSDYHHQGDPLPGTPSKTDQLERPIVVGVDGSPGGELALRWATRTARFHRLPLRVILVSDNSLPSYHAYTPPRSAETFMLREPASAARSEADFDRAMAYVRDRLPYDHISGLHSPGRATKVLLDEAAESQMIVVGSRGRSAVKAAFLGSVSSTVAAAASRPVVVVHPCDNGQESRRRVVVGVTSSEESHDALSFAFTEASVRGLPLFIVHCDDDPNDAQDIAALSFDGQLPELSDRILIYRERYPAVEVTSLLLPGEPSAVLADFSRGAELLIVGSRGRGRVSGLVLGSVSQSLLHHATCPVAVMHGEST